MKYLRGCDVRRTILFFVAALVSLAPVASAQDGRTCSATTIAGEWGYSETGTLFLPTGPIPYASLGRYTIDRDGNYSGARTASVGGTVQTATFSGTATVNSDCTGRITITFYNQAGDVVSTAVKTVVYVDNGREARAMITSVALPNGLSLPAVLTTDAKRIFSGHQQ